MARFTKELRQQIVREFAIRHNGQFNAALFLAEVRATGPDHPAYEWFTWDDQEAADQHRTWQAREFANGLKVTFTVETIGRDRAFTIKEASAPMVISPVAGRHQGGGYWLTDPDNPEHMAEHCRQAATSLRTWLRRYEAALIHAGGKPDTVNRLIGALEKAAPIGKDEAA